MPSIDYDLMRVNKEIPYTEKGTIDYKRLNAWYTPNIIVFQDHAIKVRWFTFKDHDRRSDESVLILPPQTCHSGQVVDWDKSSSLVECAIENTTMHVFAVEWIEPTGERVKETYMDLVRQLDRAVNILGNKVHLEGMCQAGVLATIYTTFHQDKVASLSVAGAPLDVNGDGVLKNAIGKPFWQYKYMVAANKGVMPAKLMLWCFMSSNITQHYVTRFQTPTDYRKARFEAWYYDDNSLQNIAGGWYLEIVEKLFLKNQLVKGEMYLEGELVNTKNITCPFYVIVGNKDDISPKSNSWNFDKVISSDVVNKYESNNGHIGVYCSEKSVQGVWKDVFLSKEFGCIKS